MRRGEVWWSEHPTAGRRPVLILTRDEAIERLNEVLIVPATRTVRDIPTHVHLDENDSMPWPCALALDTTGPLASGLFVEFITTLGPEGMSEACRALAHATIC
jgi:mRNA interferase MazF